MAKVHQFSDGEHRSVMGVAQAASPVVCLPYISSPLAIAWLVIAVIVDSFDSVIVRRSLTHIGEKVQKCFAPPIAYRNSPAAIIGKMLVFPVVTAAPHVAPHEEFRGVSAPVDSSSFASGLATQTAAGASISAFEFLNGYRLFISAIASAEPARMFFACALFVRAKSNQATKSVIRGNRHVSMYHNEWGTAT